MVTRPKSATGAPEPGDGTQSLEEHLKRFVEAYRDPQKHVSNPILATQPSPSSRCIDAPYLVYLVWRGVVYLAVL